jgi:hypothetical protein
MQFTSEKYLRSLLPIDRHRRDVVGAGKGKYGQNTSREVHMIVVYSVSQKVNVLLERVFVLVKTGIDFALDFIQFCDNVNGRLLISSRRVFEICQGTLKLQSLIEEPNKPEGNSWIEWNTQQAVVGIGGIKDCGSCSTNEFSICQWNVTAGSKPSFTVSII